VEADLHLFVGARIARMSDREEPRNSMWDSAAAGRAGTLWPVLADVNQLNLATQLQLDSPRSVRPPRVTVGATGVPDLNGFVLPPLQSVQVALQQAGLHQHQAGLQLPPLQSVQVALQQAEALQQAGQQAVGVHSLEDERSNAQSQLSPLSDVGHMAGEASASHLKDMGADMSHDMELDESEESYEGQQNYEGEGHCIVKRAWTAEEDHALLQLVQGHGPRPWSQIAKELPGRVGKQCRERWHNHVCPSVSKEEWTDAEDQLIMDLVQQMGTKWSKIATMIPGRTDNAIKNRWNSTMRRILRQQLKDEGGDSPVFQRADNLPVRKRGSATSAEVATAAAAAAVNAVAAAAFARSASAPRSSPIGKRPPRAGQARRPSLGGADTPPLVTQGGQQGEGGEQLQRPTPRKMSSAPPRRASMPTLIPIVSVCASPRADQVAGQRCVADTTSPISLEQQLMGRADAEVEAEARSKLKAEARARAKAEAKAEAKAKAEVSQQQQQHVAELQKQLAMLDSHAPKEEMRRGTPEGLRLGGDEMGLFSAALDTQVLDVSQVMGAPSPIEAPHGEAPAFRRGVKTEMRDLNPEMQEDDWMTAYQGGEEQVALQSHLQAQLQAQLQLL